MNEFKRAWKISKTSGKIKMIIMGLVPMAISVILVNLMQADLNIAVLGAFSVSAVCGNLDLSGHCKAVRTSAVRKFLYGEFYTRMTLAAVMIYYTCDFVSRLGGNLITGGDAAGKESVMCVLTAEFLALGMICFGLCGLGRYGGAAFFGGSLLSLAAGFGKASVPLLIPEPLAGNPVTAFLWGAFIIALGAAAQYFIRKKSYEKQSSSAGTLNGEEVTTGIGG